MLKLCQQIVFSNKTEIKAVYLNFSILFSTQHMTSFSSWIEHSSCHLCFQSCSTHTQMFLGFSGPDSSDGERLSTSFSRESFVSSAPSRCVDLKTRYISKKLSFVAIKGGKCSQNKLYVNVLRHLSCDFFRICMASVNRKWSEYHSYASVV